jgi:hypothetical protein
MKNLSVYLFLILFTLPTPSQADDIRDFQIEGVSVGDSLLDNYNKQEIVNKKNFLFKSKDYVSVQFYKDPRFELYDAVQFFVKEKDKNYEIYSIYGIIYFRNNIENCYPKKSEIVDEISNVFLKSKKKNYTFKYREDKSGKSKSTITEFYLQDGSIRVFCDDWGKVLEKERNWPDQLKVSIETSEFINWRKGKN